MTILVLSCDKNKDLFDLYHHCLEKYWPNHPEVVFSTESAKHTYYRTITSGNKSWGLRVKDCLDKIDDEYILLTLDDIFIREEVDPYKIDELIHTLASDKNIGYLNLEGEYRNSSVYYDDFCNIFDPNKEKYKVSVMLNLFRKDCLYKLCNDLDAWAFELQDVPAEYKYLITKFPIINFGKNEKTVCNWGLVQGKWTKECIDFFHFEGIDIDYSKRGIKLSKCFGIVSYFPWEQPERKQRQDRLDKLVKQLSNYWPDIPIIFIAQQWKHYNPSSLCKNRIIRYDFGKLGILGARQKLREFFLYHGFDYLIMFDDDAIIEKDNINAHLDYINELDKHPKGFCFIKGKGSSKYTDYNDSQLNLCAISRYIYSKEPIPNIDPQKSEAFEDRIWSTLLHFKYADKEFDAPKTIRCVHFKNPNINQLGGEVPSTWSSEQKYNWKQMRQNTRDIEDYIAVHKELPKEWIK